MMKFVSLKDSKSPNPSWGINEKGSRIMITPSLVNIHFGYVFYVPYYMLISSFHIIPPHVICYTLSHMSMHLYYLYIISHAIFPYHISPLCVIHFDALFAC